MPADTTPTADPPSRTLWFILGAAAGAVAGFVLGGAATGTAMEYERPRALPASGPRMVEGTIVSSKPVQDGGYFLFKSWGGREKWKELEGPMPRAAALAAAKEFRIGTNGEVARAKKFATQQEALAYFDTSKAPRRS